MAIVKMKKLRVMAMAAQRDALLRELLRLGCVEISERAPDLPFPRRRQAASPPPRRRRGAPGPRFPPALPFRSLPAALLRRDASQLAQTKNEQGEAGAALAALKRKPPPQPPGAFRRSGAAWLRPPPRPGRSFPPRQRPAPPPGAEAPGRPPPRRRRQKFPCKTGRLRLYCIIRMTMRPAGRRPGAMAHGEKVRTNVPGSDRTQPFRQ